MDCENRSWIFRPEATSASPAAEKVLRDAVIRGPSTVKDVLQDGGENSHSLTDSPRYEICFTPVSHLNR